MKRWHRRQAEATAAALALLVAAAGTSAAEPQKLRVSMATKASANYGPYLVANEMGYYAEEGLQLDITIAGGGVATPAQLSGTIDINTSGNVAVSPALRGSPIKIPFCLNSHSTDRLYSSTKDIKTLQDLKSKQVGIISRGDSLELGVKMSLRKSSLPLDWVNYTALGTASGPLNSLTSGALPAAVLSGISVELGRRTGVLEKGNEVYSMFREVAMPYNCNSVTETFLNSNREALRKYIRATMKGSRYVRQNKNGTIAILKKNNPDADNAIIEVDYDEVRSVLTANGTVPDDALLDELKVRASILNIPEAQIPPLGRIYDFSLVKVVNAELDQSGWKP
jgi:NitT/TauT family transport system substrate-binding protein